MGVGGTWNLEMKVDMPLAFDQGVVVELTAEGDRLAGRMEGMFGEVDLREGSIDGDNVSWFAYAHRPFPMPVWFEARVKGDAISGRVQVAGFDDAPFHGVRAG